jgi:hypothetical protein
MHSKPRVNKTQALEQEHIDLHQSEDRGTVQIVASY